ncbi:MAG: IS110 family transposase [Candidatus Methylomirabilales bacterium]
MNAHLGSTFQRFLALDLHRRYLVVGGVDPRQQVVLKPRRISLQKWPAWARANLLPTDAVVLEATTNAWEIYDQVLPLVGRVVVAHPPDVKWIAEARVKTDRHDVLRLAHLLAADLIPEVWVPPVPVRELRALMAYRRRLVQTGTRARNRLHSLLHRNNLQPPPGKIFAQKHREWWLALDLSPTQRMHIRHDLATVDQVEHQLADIQQELSRLSTAEPWADQVPFLLQLPGFGLIVTLTILAAIGDISRFSHPKKLVGYSGLGASIHDSGDKRRTGRITKRGRKELRWVLVEAAWRAADTHPYWKAQYERLERRIGSNKAAVALARKLLVAVWYILTERTADRHADPDKVAFKYIMWSWKLDDAKRNGLSTQQWTRYHLMRLQLGEDLTHIVRGGHRYPIAPGEELQALLPELQSVD